MAVELPGQGRQDAFDEPLELYALHAVGKEILRWLQLGRASKCAIGFGRPIQLDKNESQRVVRIGGIGHAAKCVLGGALGVPESRAVE